MSYRPLLKSLTIAPSEIDGLGLFAQSDIEQGTLLGISHVESDIPDLFHNDLIRTPLGGFINCNEESPNCGQIKSKETYILFTLRDIEEGEELTISYSKYKCGQGQSCAEINQNT